MTQTLNPTQEPKVVDGSGGLLLEVDGQIVPNYDATFAPFEEGEVVSGRVVRIDNDEVLVDIGYKSEGVIPSNELSIRKSVDPHDEVELGEEVDALVLTKEDQDGRLIMSKKRARFEKAWRRIEAAAESGDPVEGTVIEVVKGGLIIDLGVRGFLPASLVDIRRVPNLDEYMGTKIETKVIELNRSRNNVVLSRRAVIEEERKEVRQQILDRLQPGMIVSNEPGYYKEGGYGIRIENLQFVTEAAPIPGGERPMLGFETLTLAPIDHALVEPALLGPAEIAWLDAYHARVRETLTPLVDAATAAWLAAATRPLAAG